jgi:hypothetical protein
MFLRLKERIICNMNNRITNQRLVSQQLAVKQFDTPRQLVAYMGAVQAQECLNCDFNMIFLIYMIKNKLFRYGKRKV